MHSKLHFDFDEIYSNIKHFECNCILFLIFFVITVSWTQITWKYLFEQHN